MPPQHDPVNWKRNIYAIFVAEVLAIGGFSVSMPLIPFYLQELGVTDPTRLKYWVGAANAAGSITLAVFASLWGRIADAYGRRLMLLRALFGGALIIGLMGLVAHPWQLVLIRALQGTVTGTVTAANALVASVTPEEKTGYGLGLVQTAVFMGSTAGPMLGGVIADMAGPRMAFFVTSLLLFCGGLVITRFVREVFTPRAPVGPLWRQIFPNIRLAAGSPGLMVLFLVIFTVYIARTGILSILPLYVQALSTAGSPVGLLTGLNFGVEALAAAASAALVGRFSIRLGHRRALLACITGAMLLFVPQGLVSNPWQLVGLRILGGIFIGGTMPTANSLIVALAKRENQGEIFGLSFTVGAFGMFLGPVMTSALAAMWGYSSAFFGSALVLCVSFAVLMSMPGVRRRGAGTV